MKKGQSNKKESTVEQYLEHNSLSAKEENIEDLFQLIDTENYDMILAGEHHTVQKVTKFEEELLFYLHKNANVRYLLMEAGGGNRDFY